MNKYLSVLGRLLLAQIFLIQAVFLIINFVNTPNGYLEYQTALGQHGLPGIFAPLIILVQLVCGWPIRPHKTKHQHQQVESANIESK